jgi:preprotein translocase subunit SecE
MENFIKVVLFSAVLGIAFGIIAFGIGYGFRLGMG